MPFQPIPLVERFWPKVLKTDGCWLWRGSLNEHGYGIIHVNCPNSGVHRRRYAHHVGWEFANGPIPVGLCVLHRCDTRACVRADHLFLGTRGDNTRDMQAKGRNRAGVGIRHRKARLTEDEVREIRRRYQAGEKRVDLMLEFELGPAHLWWIGTGRGWRHINP